jgi:hypothetical protein
MRIEMSAASPLASPLAWSQLVGLDQRVDDLKDAGETAWNCKA